MTGFSDTQGAVGGPNVAPSPLELFTPQVWRETFQQYQERTFVFGEIPPIEVLPGNTVDFRYQLRDPVIMDAGKETPDEVIPGAQFPEITVSDVTWEKGVITSYGYKQSFDVDVKNDAKMMMRAREAMVRWVADWLEGKCFELMTGATLTDSSGILSTTTTFADGGEFDNWFLEDGHIEGGYCTSGGITDTICLGQQDGYEWHSDEGNPIMDLLRINALLKDQMNAAGTNAPEGQYVYIPWEQGNTVCIGRSTDTQALYAWLLNQTEPKYQPVNNNDGSFSIPALWGWKFREANRGMPQGTINIGDETTGYGLFVIYDESEPPWQGYQYFPDNWNNWSRAGVINGWDMMGWKRDIMEDERGLSKAAMWTSIGIETYFPRKLCLYGGFRKGEYF